MFLIHGYCCAFYRAVISILVSVRHVVVKFQQKRPTIMRLSPNSSTKNYSFRRCKDVSEIGNVSPRRNKFLYSYRPVARHSWGSWFERGAVGAEGGGVWGRCIGTGLGRGCAPLPENFLGFFHLKWLILVQIPMYYNRNVRLDHDSLLLAAEVFDRTSRTPSLRAWVTYDNARCYAINLPAPIKRTNIVNKRATSVSGFDDWTYRRTFRRIIHRWKKNVFWRFSRSLFLSTVLVFIFQKRSLKISPRTSRSNFETIETNIIGYFVSKVAGCIAAVCTRYVQSIRQCLWRHGCCDVMQ